MAAAHHFDDKKANFKVLLTTAFGAKEVDCRVRLTIHTVTNLPVLDGAYRVRWKFRDISAKATRAQHNKQLAVNLGVGEVGHASTNSDPTLSPSSPTSSTAHSSSVTANSKPSDVNISPDERGTTAYRNLNKRDHSVTFEHTVEVVAHMRVVRGELIGEPLKLVIERYTDETTESGTMKFEPRVGHKFIDLAEFVNEGKVRRKYLLERSKTNAMVTVSLDIRSTKTGIEFKKPDLRQDHLLIGRKEIGPPKRDHPLTPLNTTFNGSRGDSLQAGLSRTSSTTSSASSIRGQTSRGLPPPRSETEAVIEALFNPTIFSSHAVTPSSASPRVSLDLPTPRLNEAHTPRPRAEPAHRNSRSRQDSDSSSDSDDIPRSELSNGRAATSTHSHSPGPERHRHSTLNDQGKSALEIALQMNENMDHNQKTIRPKPITTGSSQAGSWEIINFREGAPGIRKRNHPDRSGTGDSTSTDFSTTSSQSQSSVTSSGHTTIPDNVSSSKPSGTSPPMISIIAETPTTARPEDRGRWYRPRPFKKKSEDDSAPSSRSSTPAPTDRVAGPMEHRRQRPSVDAGLGDALRMIVMGDKPLVSAPEKIEDTHEGSLLSGQVTPTPPRA